jgi:tetratricopeptide (TPR) repeat protein
VSPFGPLTPQVVPRVRDPVDARVGLNARPAPIGPTQRRVIPPLQPDTAEDVSPAYRSAAGSSIFGTLRPEARLPAPSVGLRSLDERPDEAEVGEAPTAKPGPEAPAAAPAGVEQPAARPGEQAAGGVFAQRQTKRPAGLDSPLPMDGSVPANLGADRFADLYNAVRALQQAGVREAGFEPAAARPVVAAPSEPARPGSGLARRPSEGLAQLATSAKWASTMLDDPLKTFVGRYRTRLNEYMAAGEAAMGEGAYYRAATQFDLAHAVDPQNPLPLLQRGHALVAAGDYLSGLKSLELGLARFPQIAAFRMDLIALVGGRDVYDVRRADLEGKLKARESYEFRFLLGYLELYSGLADVGLKDLARAAELAPADSPVKTFSGLVSGDKPLPKLGG